MKLPIHGCALLVLLALSGLFIACSGPPRGSHPVVVSPTGEIFVRDRPPQARAEYTGVPPSSSDVWVPGYWSYNNEQWVWIPGMWQVPPQTGQTWVAGHWDYTVRGWVFTPGHWE